MRYKTRKAIQLWLKDQGYNEVKVARADDFYYTYSQNLISCGDRVVEEALSSLAGLCEKFHLKYDTPANTLCFLHELGHHNTEDNFSQIQEYAYIVINKILDTLLIYCPVDLTKPINWLYQRLPQEAAATKWAINFINNNPAATQELSNIILSIHRE